MDLSSLNWIKVITDDDKSKWAYTRLRLKEELEHVIDFNDVAIFPLGFKKKYEESCRDIKQGDFIALIQKGKLTHIVEILDKIPYGDNEWLHRLARIHWWKPESEWSSLVPQSELLGFDPCLMNGRPQRIVLLKRYIEFSKNDDSFEDFIQNLSEKLKKT